MSHRHSEVGRPVPFFTAFSLRSVATRYPFAAGWTVSEHPNFDPRARLEPPMFRSAVKRSNHLATRPSEHLELIEKGLMRMVLRIQLLQYLSPSTEDELDAH